MRQALLQDNIDNSSDEMAYSLQSKNHQNFAPSPIDADCRDGVGAISHNPNVAQWRLKGRGCLESPY
jgi:hypothetical protein